MAKKATPSEWMYLVLKKPIVTEKTAMMGEGNWMTFEVPMDITKPQITQAVETLYDVKVEKVNTLIQKGKTKRFRGRLGRRSDVKKAVIRLAEGQSIDIAAGV